ncbi:adenylylsulfatase HINT3 [Cocos nucifera]|uniref:Adenylylsulfatase HINT3 n=1 Tax=Cocos nucifera TaxID=13894 RepID=A0A8K0I0L5_COCNU|nr:adenylylsulfatase HINT3 [Cocos nucifera]
MAECRLAVLCSHLCPTDLGRPLPLHRRPGSSEPQAVSVSCCRGSGSEAGGEEGIGKKRCVFCEIIRGESPAFKLYEDDVCLCILDSNPLSCGHSLIIPKSHFPSLEATSPPVIAAMCSKIPFLSNAIMKATQCDSFNLLVNNGSAAGQVIFHTHFHIIPRKAGDHLWSSESCRRQPLKWNQETVDLVNCIQERLSPVSSDSCRTLGLMLPRCVQD